MLKITLKNGKVIEDSRIHTWANYGGMLTRFINTKQVKRMDKIVTGRWFWKKEIEREGVEDLEEIIMWINMNEIETIERIK
jgi:hypothetical protein